MQASNPLTSSIRVECCGAKRQTSMVRLSFQCQATDQSRCGPFPLGKGWRLSSVILIGYVPVRSIRQVRGSFRGQTMPPCGCGIQAAATASECSGATGARYVPVRSIRQVRGSFRGLTMPPCGCGIQAAATASECSEDMTGQSATAPLHPMVAQSCLRVATIDQSDSGTRRRVLSGLICLVTEAG